MKKLLVFDMDGTIADLYGVENWLQKLNEYNPSPYAEARPMWDMSELADILTRLKPLGYKVVITSWLSMETTVAYDREVRTAKIEWLTANNFPYDELHIVKYGTTKANCTRHHICDEQILFDDNEKVRKGWTLGETVDPIKTNIIEYLKGLLDL